MVNTQKTRVLHLIKTLGLGGAESNLCNLIQFFDPERFETHIGYSFGGVLEKRFIESGARLFKFADKNHKIKSPASLTIIARLVAYVFKNNIQIIHTHNFNAHIWGMIAAKLTGAKIIEHVHDFRYLDRGEYKKRRGEVSQYKFIKYFKNCSDIVIVLTKQNADYLLTHKFCRQDQIRIIRNGIPVLDAPKPDAAAAGLLKQKLGLNQDARVILSSCRIAPEKNVDLILRIAPAVRKACANAVFLVSGDGPLLEEFKSVIKAQGLEDSVKMIGFYQQIDNLLGISDLFLLPSFLELHSIAILEAMNAKVTVIVSKDVGCNGDFINNRKNGVLLDPFVDAGWAEATIGLLQDSQLRKRIGENGYQYCQENFNIKNVAEKIQNIYGELGKKSG
jgi:L-malate glycosyltransferase